MDEIKRPIYRHHGSGVTYEFIREIRVVVYRNANGGAERLMPAEVFYDEFDYIPSEER